MSACCCPKCTGSLAPLIQRTVGTLASMALQAPEAPAAPAMILRTSFATGITFDVDVRMPPVLTARVYEAIARLSAAHARAGSAPLVVTSWWRDASTNLAVGGASNSQHLSGTAFDLRVGAAGAAVAREWALAGGEISDETGRSIGPHWHLELPD